MQDKQYVDIREVEMPKTWPEKLNAMEINESISIDNDSIQVAKNAVSRIHESTDKQFTFRTIKQTGEKRVWRLK